MSELKETTIEHVTEILGTMMTRIEEQGKLNAKENNDTLVIMSVALGDEVIVSQQGLRNAVYSNGFSSLENAIAVLFSVVRTARDVVADFYTDVARKEPELGVLLLQLLDGDEADVEAARSDKELFRELVTRLLVEAISSMDDCGLTLEQKEIGNFKPAEEPLQ